MRDDPRPNRGDRFMARFFTTAFAAFLGTGVLILASVPQGFDLLG